MTDDEQDSLAANCGYCWARPGQACRLVSKADRSKRGRKRRPHKLRVQRAARRGIMNGIGRMLLEQNRRIDG